MKKIIFAALLACIAIGTNVPVMTHAAPPQPTFPTLVKTYILKLVLPTPGCKVYRHFTTYSDAMLFLSISAPNTWQYIGEGYVLPVQVAPYPGIEIWGCNGGVGTI